MSWSEKQNPGLRVDLRESAQWHIRIGMTAYIWSRKRGERGVVAHGRGVYGVRGGGYQDEPSRKLKERKYLKLNFPKYFPYSAQSMINPIGKNNWQQEYVQSNTTLFKRRNATRSNSRESSLPSSHFPGELSTTVAAQIWPLARERKRQTTAIRYNGKMQRRYV